MRRKRAGYTLMEITLVLAMIVLLGAMALPSMSGTGAEVKTRAAADAFRGALLRARAHAIDEGRSYSVAIVPGNGHYRIAPESMSFWNGSGDTDESGNSTGATIEEGVLPAGIHFASENGDDQSPDTAASENDSVDLARYAKQATFLPDGTAVEDRTVTFRAEGSRPLVLRLRALTGGVTVGPAEAEGGQP